MWSEADKAYHYVDVVMYAEVDVEKTEEPVNMEPDKCRGRFDYQKMYFPSIYCEKCAK